MEEEKNIEKSDVSSNEGDIDQVSQENDHDEIEMSDSEKENQHKTEIEVETTDNIETGVEAEDNQTKNLNESEEKDENVTTIFPEEDSPSEENVEFEIEDDDEKIREMLESFEDLEDLDMEEMMDIQSAIQEVKQEESDVIEGEISNIIEEGEISESSGEIEAETEEFQPEELSDQLENRIKEELEKKRKAKKIITEDIFKQYCQDRRTKIWYHALWYLVFDVEDHQATKATLYDMLKEVTSKNAIDPIPKHKFYFGLGFILRLSLNQQKIIDFQKDALKLNVGYDILVDVLREVGPPISERPVITSDEKKQMFEDFLGDDFMDI